jgi:DNA-binding NarL/FixJ family response regulator
VRVLLVGSPSERARLRAQANGSIEVAGEFDSLAAARASELDSDALLVAPDSSDPDEDGFDEPLTAREVQVLELLAEGLPNKAIAARLGISDQTVKFHVSSISGKLGARNRTDAVRRAARRGLITL